jgi:hypothetical protein
MTLTCKADPGNPGLNLRPLENPLFACLMEFASASVEKMKSRRDFLKTGLVLGAGLPYQSLINAWLTERADEELAKAGG